MNKKDSIIGFLTELYELIQTEPILEFPEHKIYDEQLECLNTTLVMKWKEKVDQSTIDLAQRWLQEDIDLESSLPQWANLFYEDPEFTSALQKISELVDHWKKVLTEALYKDKSVYTMPKNQQYVDELESEEEEDEDSLEEIKEIMDEEMHSNLSYVNQRRYPFSHTPVTRYSMCEEFKSQERNFSVDSSHNRSSPEGVVGSKLPITRLLRPSFKRDRRMRLSNERPLAYSELAHYEPNNDRERKRFDSDRASEQYSDLINHLIAKNRKRYVKLESTFPVKEELPVSKKEIALKSKTTEFSSKNRTTVFNKIFIKAKIPTVIRNTD